jgi:hypothetical protein
MGSGSTGSVLTLENSNASLTTNDVIGQIDFYANDTSTNGTGAKVNIKAIATSTAGTLTALTFGTSDNTSATAVEAMRINPNGNVGIGVSPSEKLEVAGNIHVSGGDRTIFNRSNNSLALGTNNTERMRIDSSGNVGIGTSSGLVSGLTIARNTGSATPTPAEFRLWTTTPDASNWSTSLPWGRFSFYSTDPSDSGPKIQAAVDSVATLANGGRAKLSLKTSDATTGTLTERMAVSESSAAASVPVIAPNFYSEEFTLSVPATTPTSILNLPGVATTNRYAGIIFVRANTGSLRYAHILFSKGTSGGSSEISVTSAGTAAAGNVYTITVTGEDILIEQSSTQVVRVTVIYFVKNGT